MTKPTAEKPTFNASRVKKDGAKRTYSRKRKSPNQKSNKKHKVVVVESPPEDVIIESIEEAVVVEAVENFSGVNVVAENVINCDKTASTSKVVDIESG